MKNKVLDTSGWREFRIGDLFEKIKTNKLDFKATDLKDKTLDAFLKNVKKLKRKSI